MVVFYKLPYGWSSNVVSAIRAAYNNGIAHTQSPGFQYRASSFTISYDISCIEDKIQANLIAKKVLLQLVSTAEPQNNDK